MQLIFSADEYRLLLELLLERERQSEIARRQGDHIVPIVQRFITHDLALALDELEDLEEFLKDEHFRLDRELGRATPGPARDELLRRCLILDHALDRVTEACAMA